MVIERWLVFKISKYSHETLWLVFRGYIPIPCTNQTILEDSYKLFIASNFYTSFSLKATGSKPFLFSVYF